MNSNSYLRTEKLFKVGFLGGGYDSAVGRAHKIAVEMDDLFEVVTGCFSLNNESNIKTATHYHIESERTYLNIDNLIKSENSKIDALVILTPTDQHKDQVIRAVSAGIPVICEKALVASSEDALAVKNQLDKCSGFLAVTYNYTGYPMLRELKYIIETGRLGDVQQINIEMPQEGFSRLDKTGKPIVPQNWRLKDEYVPTVSLDLGIHIHNVVSFLVRKRPLRVASLSGSYGNYNQITDSINCIAEYEDGISANIWYGKTAIGYRNGLRVRVFGSKGGAEWLQTDPEILYFSDCFGNRYTVDRASPDIEIANMERYTRFKAGHPAGFVEAFANYYVDIADQLSNYLSGKKPSNSYVFGIDEALNGIVFLEAISDSVKTMDWVEVQ